MKKYWGRAALGLFAMLAAGIARSAPNAPDLGDFLTGRLTADGKFSDYIAGNTRDMRVNIVGEKRGDTLYLTEEMIYSDGEKRKYIWRFTQQNGTYVGHRSDLVGSAKITQSPRSVEIAYQANIVLPKGGEQVLDFVETLTFDTRESARLRIKISKFFLPVANADLVVKKIASTQ
ncbi:MAG: DUF3833 family protein [Methylocystis sp.]|uniref:DUF3833 family protein n=1 Tax=Methylocystis sp. TaxID=1911079 RepID=UPI003DA54FD2